jgi:hypothetical protein
VVQSFWVGPVEVEIEARKNNPNARRKINKLE